MIPRPWRALVAPFTTTIYGLVSEVGLEPGEDPAPNSCVVNMDPVETVSVVVLVERLGRLADMRLADLRSPRRRGRLCRLTLSRWRRTHANTLAELAISHRPGHDRPGEPPPTGQGLAPLAGVGSKGAADRSCRSAAERATARRRCSGRPLALRHAEGTACAWPGR
ncbi:hypothetical protein [Geodermatophilus sp. SYSU D01036]